MCEQIDKIGCDNLANNFGAKNIVCHNFYVLSVEEKEGPFLVTEHFPNPGNIDVQARSPLPLPISLMSKDNTQCCSCDGNVNISPETQFISITIYSLARLK